MKGKIGISNILKTKLNWEETAIRDEDSVEGRLRRMVSAEYFREANDQIIQSFPLHHSLFNRLEYQRVNSEISKVKKTIMLFVI